MNKPLKDWTLGELKAECVKRNAFCETNGKCPFFVSQDGMSRCKISHNIRSAFPGVWDLSEPPRWTEDEVKFAKLFQAACKNKIFFERLEGSQLLMWGEEGIDPTANAVLPYKLLPSLKEGKRATLDEIIGGTNE